MKRSVAIVGGGIAGVCLSYFLSEKGADVTLFDPQGIAGGASGVSTGLLHPFPGKKALRSQDADLGMAATFELIEIVERELGIEVAKRTGIFRPAVFDHQKENFSLRALQDEDAIWCEKSPFGEGIWIEKGATVFTEAFLKGLFTLSQRKGAKLIYEKVACLEELSSYDKVILAMGEKTLEFPLCKNLPLKVTKGQTLLCEWKEPLAFSLVSMGHISPTQNPRLSQVGSTYEHGFLDLLPDPKVALSLIEKVAHFYPDAKNLKVEEIRSGARISPIAGYLPLIEKVGKNTWVFTGLGSRGMLYAALYARKLSQKIEQEAV